MKHRYIILAIAAPLLLGACGIFKFGVGKVQDESEYKSVAVLEDGRTLLFTFSDCRVKREPMGLGWEKRVIYLRDTQYLCALDLETGKQRILKELQNNRHGAPYGDMVLGTPHGNKILISHLKRGAVPGQDETCHFLFDGDVFANQPRAALTELKSLRSASNQTVQLVDSRGALLLRKKVEQGGSSSEDLVLRRADGITFEIGRTTRTLNLSWQDLVCFRDSSEDLTWHSASTVTGDVKRLQGSPTAAGLKRDPYRVRAIRLPEASADGLMLLTALADGGQSETLLRPHLALHR